MKRFIFFLLIFTCFTRGLKAFDWSKIIVNFGYDKGLDTYFITNFDNEIFDSRTDKTWLFNRWNSNLGVSYNLNKRICGGLFFQFLKIYEQGGAEDEILMSVEGGSGKYIFFQKGDLSLFSNLKAGFWQLLDSKYGWVERELPLFVGVKVGVSYKFFKILESELYINREIIYYRWGSYLDAYTTWHMWSMGIGFNISLFHSSKN